MGSASGLTIKFLIDLHDIMKILILKYAFSHPLIWLAGIVLILFCSVGMAAIKGWVPPLLMIIGLGILCGTVLGLLLGNRIGLLHGNDCELIDRGSAGKSLALQRTGYVITICLEDGCSIVHEANPSAWRTGVRVDVIPALQLPPVDIGYE